MKKNVTVLVEKQPGEKNFSAMVQEEFSDFLLAGYGKTAKEAMEDIYVADNDLREIFMEEGKPYPELSFSFMFDIGALFSYYDCLNATSIAKCMGINTSLMLQYVSGKKVPSKKRMAQIESCVHDISEELCRVSIG